MLGVQRPSLNKALKQFERRGLLAVGYRSIRILDETGLQRLADGRP
jgi:CRP/FNR family transcriptional regulator, cAMP and macrophage regulator